MLTTRATSHGVNASCHRETRGVLRSQCCASARVVVRGDQARARATFGACDNFKAKMKDCVSPLGEFSRSCDDVRYDPLKLSTRPRDVNTGMASRGVMSRRVRCPRCGATSETCSTKDGERNDGLKRRIRRGIGAGTMGSFAFTGRARALSGNGGSAGGGINDGGGDGDGSFGSHDGKPSFASASTGGDGILEEVVMLDVHGMHCGGCAASVRKLLEGDDDVRTASVNLANESAVVRINLAINELNGGEFEDAVKEAAKNVGTKLAELVTAAGFPTSLRDAGGVAVAGVTGAEAAKQKREERLRRIKESTRRVIIAWGLALSLIHI